MYRHLALGWLVTAAQLKSLTIFKGEFREPLKFLQEYLAPQFDQVSGQLLHVLDHWCYLGTVRSEDELDGLEARPAFDLDTYKILKRFLGGGRGTMEIVPFAA